MRTVNVAPPGMETPALLVLGVVHPMIANAGSEVPGAVQAWDTSPMQSWPLGSSYVRGSLKPRSAKISRNRSG